MSHQPRKRFGQHFLHNTAITHKIVSAINPTADDLLVEIGPGLGALTKHVLPMTSQYHVIEIDRDVVPKLQKKCAELGELVIHNVDALSFNFQELIRNDQQKLRLFGNLPYNISTPLLFHLLDFIDIIEDMHFMLQYEVAERLCAAHGSKIYGRLSIMIQYFCHAQVLFEVPPEAFHPKPKVNSAVIRLIPRTPIIKVKNMKKFARIVNYAFMHRRKTIRNALKTELSSADLVALNIDPKSRPEQLSVWDFVTIANSEYKRYFWPLG